MPPDVRGSHNVVARRASARALSRIADTASVEGLTAHLADEDADVVKWAAYGLGHACKTREDATVKMLSARAATLGADAGAAARSVVRGTAEVQLDQHVAATEELLCALLVEDGARVDLLRDAIGNARREVRLDHAGDDVDRRPLRREDHVHAGGARLLRETRC
jgi:hypothetical protein